MAWIESHQGIERHPKTLKLSIAMGWDIDQTIGKLHRFWWWCLDYASDGNVSRHSADMVAISIGLSADMGNKFINAMYESEYLDKTKKNEFLIHDWLEYAGRYLRDTKYKRTPEKVKEIVTLYSAVVSRQSADNPPKVRRKSAVPNQPTNQPNQPNQEAIFVLPDWIPKSEWDAFIKMRSKIKKPLIDDAIGLAVSKLEKLKAEGHKPEDVLNQSVFNSWQGLFPVKDVSNNTAVPGKIKGAIDYEKYAKD